MTVFQNQPACELADSENRILISAEHGARILRWTHKDREVITWPESADWSKVAKVRGGNPVLFPFVARHFVEGKLGQWQDAAGTVREMPAHGFCRDTPFTIIAQDPTSVRMRVTDSDLTRPMYPFALQFDVVIELLPESNLRVSFEVSNLDDKPLPYYAGHHFYFAISHSERAHWRLNCPASSWARQNATGQILHEEPTSELLRLDDPNLIDRFHVHPLGHRVTLFNAVTNQKLLLELRSATPWFAVTTWTETPESDFYCIEPWLGLPNAIHHREGLRMLAPGATEIATCTLDASAW